MIFINVYKHLHSLKITHFTRVMKSKKNWFENVQWYQEPKLFTAPINIYYTSKRFFFQKENPSQTQLPPLTDNKPILPLNNIFNIITSTIHLSFLGFVYENENYAEEFLAGSQQALEVVSKAIAAEDFDRLKELLTDNVVTELKRRVPKLSEAQKQLIPVSREDICYCFPQKICRNKKTVSEKKIASIEITLIYISYRKSNRSRIDAIISNCCFKREWTNDIPSPWVITMYNQFTLPGILLKEEA